MKEIFAIQQGDEIVFEQVYAAHHEKLYFYIFSKTSSNYIAEEVVQLTFIKLWKYRQSLSTTLTIEAQLFRISKTTLIDLLRKNANQRRLIENIKDEIPLTDDNAMMHLQQKQTAERIAVLIENLPPVCKKVFKLSREVGLTHREIAEQLSLTPKNVENHIAKAIRQLKKGLYTISILWLVTTTIIIFFNKYF